ncbi:MAG: HAD-IB family hydrolase [Chloroflexota bacterium]
MTIAIFDLDNTLLSSDSEWMWSRYLYQRKIVDDKFLSRIDEFFDEYEKGSLDLFDYEFYLMNSIKFLNEKERQRLRGGFLEQIKDVIRPALIQRVNDHRIKKHQIIMITAANNFLAEPISELLGFDNLICTQINMRNQKNMGKIIGMPAYREGKTSLLNQWLTQRNETLDQSWGYSDSHNDLPILKMVTYPVAVVPDNILREHADFSGWEIIENSDQ